MLGSGCPNSPHDYRIGAGVGARFLAVVPILSYLAAMLTYILGVTECMLCVHVVFPNPFMHAFSRHQCKVCCIEFASYTCTTPSYFVVE